MPTLRLTSKLLAEIDDQAPPDIAAMPSPLGDWYGHVFTIERRKCIIFINEPTLFVCPALGVVKADYRRIVPFFVSVLAQALRATSFTEDDAEWILGHHREIALGRATNRSALGSLNNRIADSKAYIASDGGFSVSDIGSLTRWLNETPMKPIGYSNGVEQIRRVVDSGHLATTTNNPEQTKSVSAAKRAWLGSGEEIRQTGEAGTKPNEESARNVKHRNLIYQFKITLLDSKPQIWRRIQLKDCTLDKLHEFIQTAMGWTNSHLHQFTIDEALFGDPMLMEEDDFEAMGFEDSTETLLSELIPKGRKPFAFSYEYDFGDSWNHKIAFEGFPNPEKGVKYPVCLEGARACPPEDVGGVSGYDEFLRAISDPMHEEHEAFLKWAGRAFDPEIFSATAATKRMRQGMPNWREMA